MQFNPAPKPPKREPKPKTAIKRTAIVKKPYTFKKSKPIRKTSAKQSEKQSAYKSAKIEKAETQPIECEACGAWGMCTPSHLIPQGKNFELAAKVWNIHWHCQFPCHDRCESGHFWEMNDGLQILEILWRHRKERFWKFWHDHEQNQSLWQQSSMFDSEIHS